MPARYIALISQLAVAFGGVSNVAMPSHASGNECGSRCVTESGISLSLQKLELALQTLLLLGQAAAQGRGYEDGWQHYEPPSA